ncbi:hypothetical protein MTP03_23790 [Tsukamurella sp. PLM1]|nr:hypothetical protein MTP03_23790 [Tsukamurella sp. PLM1]
MRVVVEHHEHDGCPGLDGGVDLHAVHEEGAVAGEDHRGPAGGDRRADARRDAVAHTAHPQGDQEALAGAEGQAVHRGGPGVAGVREDEGVGGDGGG